MIQTSAWRKHFSKIVVVVFLISQVGLLFVMTRGTYGADFAAYYIAARSMQQGRNIYTLSDADWQSLAVEYDVPSVEPPYRYPPLIVGILAPFANLPFKSALLIWRIITVAALFMTAFALSKVCIDRWVDPIVFGALAMFGPAWTSLYAGQANTLVLLGLALYLLLIKRNQIAASGLALAAAVMIKPLPAPLIFHLIWKRDLKKIAALAIGLTSMAIAMIVVSGLQVNLDYLANAGAISPLGFGSPPITYPPNQSLFGFFGRALTLNEYGLAVMDDPILSQMLTFASIGLLLIGIALMTWPKKNAIDQFLLETGLILVAINLIVPVGWYHQSVISIISIVLAWHAARSNNQRYWIAAAFILFCLQGLVWHNLIGQTFLLSLGTYGSLITYAVILRQLYQHRSIQPPTTG